MKGMASDKNLIRDSGIELFKVIAIGLIVISHVTQTLGSENTVISYSDYLLNCSQATTSVTGLILAVMRHFGALGNWMFFIASAWFLLDSSKVSKKKIAEMLLDIWMVSVIILVVTFLIVGGGYEPEAHPLFDVSNYICE